MNDIVPADGVPVVTEHNLTSLIQRARDVFSEGDIKQAKLLADIAYDQAKTFARLAVSQTLIAKAHQLQGDALMIESQAKIRLANEYDSAQAAGVASTGGRPKTVDDGNGFTSEQAGIDRKELFNARKLRDAENKSPGIVERAIKARIEGGLEPTKAALRHAIGTESASKEDRGNNLYETPAVAVKALLAVEDFVARGRIFEPACGRGAIMRELENQGFAVEISDLVDYGTATSDGVLQDVCDFLEAKAGDRVNSAIITNPPYGEVMNPFIAHALKEFRPCKMALLLNWNAYAGFDNADRNFWLDEWKPSRIWLFSRRLPMMHRDGWNGPEASSRMNTAWFVWDNADSAKHRPYARETILRRIDWKDYQ